MSPVFGDKKIQVIFSFSSSFFMYTFLGDESGINEEITNKPRYVIVSSVMYTMSLCKCKVPLEEKIPLGLDLLFF